MSPKSKRSSVAAAAAAAATEGSSSPTTRSSTRSSASKTTKKSHEDPTLNVSNRTPPRPGVAAAAAASSATKAMAIPTPRSGGIPPATPNTLGSAGASGSKKRPYRRTKRPVNYCDKSTVTTTTAPLTADKFNAFDIVLKESQDLLQAATEAQQLGRLKMSSTYLLLLHARLVGLGKRFDKAELDRVKEEGLDVDDDDEDDKEGMVVGGGGGNDNEASRHAPDSPPSLRTKRSSAAATANASQEHGSSDDGHPLGYLSPPGKRARLDTEAGHDGENSNSSFLFTPKTRAAKQLASMLPNNIEMDQAMMEHLAKAAAQLHAARSGKLRRQQMYTQGHQVPTTSTTTTAGGAADHDQEATDAREFLAQTSNEQGMVTARDMEAWQGGNDATTMTTTALPSASFSNNRAVSFTVQEYQMLHTAAHQANERGQPLDTRKLAKQTGRPEDQIKKFVNSLNTKTRLAQELELDEAMGIVKRGRGRKPATTAINTVPEFHCNARDLMKGGILQDDEEEETTMEQDQEEEGTAGATKEEEEENEGENPLVAAATNRVLI